MTRRERHHAEWGWLLFKIMATIFYDSKDITSTRVFEGLAEEGLQKMRGRATRSPFQFYRRRVPSRLSTS